ncbi:unnamed protein product [Miscanthus lutarioriparius]|uniref:Methyltransferase n=1 Tax=Miscanthus lutarioriparius TaxID=422564 RepID=A0A811QKQ8_9POAL|nr:unnamed protein product [Miscanthus lutarioriparius]
MSPLGCLRRRASLSPCRKPAYPTQVLDVRCGIGGALREIARFRCLNAICHSSSTDITGLNNNAYQISRGKMQYRLFAFQELNFSAGLSEQCNFIKGDFMNMPFPDNTFDAANAIEATIYAPDVLGAYREIYRVLKPGQYFALDGLRLTDKFDPNNAKHRDLKAKIELGCALPDVRTTRQCIQAMKEAGFEVLDLAEDSPCPWYWDIDAHLFSWSSFSYSGVAKFLMRAIAGTLEFLRIAPKGSSKLVSMLHSASNDLIISCREQIFTVTFFVLGRKPLKESDV